MIGDFGCGDARLALELSDRKAGSAGNLEVDAGGVWKSRRDKRFPEELPSI